MSIHYKVIPRKNPQNPSAPPKYYAQTITNGKMDLEALAQRIAQNTTMGVGDIFGVLKTLEEAIINALGDGMSVELGGICDIYPQVSGPGAETAEAFSAATNITRKKIRIRPKARLNRNMETIAVVRRDS
jgi:predicted histone-like DNA-binding protein